MRIPKKEHLIYFNNIINSRDLAVFVFGNSEDQEVLMGNGNPFKINATVMDQQQVFPSHFIYANFEVKLS